jgi:hypothetical protein
MSEGEDRLAALTHALEEAAARLRAEDLSPEDAAALADECARIATEAAGELDARARAAGA